MLTYLITNFCSHASSHRKPNLNQPYYLSVYLSKPTQPSIPSRKERIFPKTPIPREIPIVLYTFLFESYELEEPPPPPPQETPLPSVGMSMDMEQHIISLIVRIVIVLLFSIMCNYFRLYLRILTYISIESSAHI